MTQAALRQIEEELQAIVSNATDEHPIDLFALGVIARRIGAQAEMLERSIEP